MKNQHKPVNKTAVFLTAFLLTFAAVFLFLHTAGITGWAPCSEHPDDPACATIKEKE